ncbi:hypothetical protein [Streptomyces sp. NPDC088775]|uniref:hypothetical protein n=1 Tax=Streptomyces sp. NPDC088775 TaxID=3365896 RepID=UPI0037FDC8F7
MNLLPEDVPEREAFTITVEYRGSGRYRVIRDELCFLSADGKWSWGYQWAGGDREPVTDSEWDDYHAGRDAWVASHQFDLETALHLAEQAAPHVRVMRTTAAQALADYVAEMERTGCAD